jgi:beta-mannosidase
LDFPLHDHWRFFEPRGRRWLAARVPGNIHLDLLRHKLIDDPFWGSNEKKLEWIEHEDWTYQSSFRLPAGMLAEEQVDLVAEGLDTLAAITINGRLLAKTESMFTGYRFPAKRLLKPGLNRIEIRFSSHFPYVRRREKFRDWQDFFDERGGASNIRKSPCAFGWDWGPRLVSSGIFRPLKLQAWSGNRIDSLRISQKHRGAAVALSLLPQPAKKTPGLSYLCRLSLKGRLVAESARLDFKVPKPQKWWPNGLGEQPLYDLELIQMLDGKAVDVCRRRIGLRRIELDRHKDRWGESFQFKINGLALFAKGANWIPAHSLLPKADRAMLTGLLESAQGANMNMLRVWGGGTYESEAFYDLCDELGLLVWQDFMFACSPYPADPAFKKLVAAEAGYQVKRLANRACLALWCGNNENEQEPQRILQSRLRARAHEALFYGILPKAVKKYDGVTAYWPSSPHNPAGWRKGHNSEKAGDAHFWDVWHARKPVKAYESKRFRFCSEFGMQSYSSPEVAATFCEPSKLNVFSADMENHQKNPAGNQIILDYISRRYRFPTGYANLAYLSQLNQAYCMQVGVEHFRRSMPRTMGALYWQLNDCWPVFSWSSLEFGGKWKALHYAAKRFFAPALASAHILGDESATHLNGLQSGIRYVNLHTVYDGREPLPARLSWELHHFEKGVVLRGSKAVRLRHNESRLQQRLDLGPAMARYGAPKLALRLELSAKGKLLSENTALLTAPRFLELKRAQPALKIKKAGVRSFEVGLSSKAFLYQVDLSLGGTPHRSSDNFFDLYPGRPRKVEISLEKPLGLAAFRRRLRAISLADSTA